MAQETASITPDVATIRRFRRAFVRGLNPGRRLNSTGDALVVRAITLTIASQRALLDPNTTVNDKVRLDRLAALARRDAKRAVDAGRRAPQPAPLLNLAAL
jgi:hypothetical protein